MSEPLIVRMEHIRKMSACSDGARRFCKRHGINWTDFLENGIDAEVLLATGDAQAAELVEVARNG